MDRERWWLGGPYRIDDRGAWAGGGRSDVTGPIGPGRSDRADVAGLIWPGWWRCRVKLWEDRLF
jgi:hypothetical protein